MTALSLLFLCTTMGIFLKRWVKLPDSTPKVLNTIVLTVSLPAVVLFQIHRVFSDPNFALIKQDLWVAPIACWLLFLLSIPVFFGLAHFFQWSDKSKAALILTAGLGNTSFVGFPLIEWLYGANWIPVAVFSDQLGTFLILSTLGIAIASFYSGRKKSRRDLFKSVLKFPPFAALVTGLLASFLFPGPWPRFVDETLERVGATLVPLALMSVGFQLSVPKKWFEKKIVLGLVYKQCVGPAVVTGLLMLLISLSKFAIHPQILKVSFLETAMAPMISASVICEEYGLDSELSRLLIAIGIPLSFFSVPLLSQVLDLWIH